MKQRFKREEFGLRFEGRSFEFASESAAKSLQDWLRKKGRETGYINVFYDSMRDIWILTQHLRVLTKIAQEE